MKYDLIVIGGGILGVSHALAGLKKGLKVILIEKDIEASGSSIQNFGQIVPSGLGDEWFNFGKRSLEIYKEIQAEFDLGVVSNGTTYLASDDFETTLINELHQKFKEKEYTSSLLSKEDCLKKFPRLNPKYIKEGLYFPDEISVNPKDLVKKLKEYLIKKYDLKTAYSQTVQSVEEGLGAYAEVKLSNQTKILGNKLILCCGYTTNILFSDLLKNSGLKLCKLQMLETRKFYNDTILGNILTGLSIRRYESFLELPSFKNKTTPEHYQDLEKWGIHLLFKQNPDGSIIIGDSHEYVAVNEPQEWAFGTLNKIDSLVIKEAERIFKLDFEHKIARRWSGFYVQHPFGILNLKVNSHVNICTGIGGKGMTSSLGYAESNLEKILK